MENLRESNMKKAFLLGHNMCLSTNGNCTNPFSPSLYIYSYWQEGYDFALQFILL
ncbi:MAG: hypothetical protein V4506_14485 [Bacteroidota bacterium]